MTTMIEPPTDRATPPLDESELDGLLAYWEAANYLTVAQIYLRDNPLLREPLRPEHIKPRLLGHWGTSPGLNLVYAQLNRLIRRTEQEVLYIAGPGHGGPAVVANVYLEGTYSEIYPQVSADEAGLLALVRQFSTPGGIPSHVSVPTPGSIHEGGELGYALVHAFGAAFDNPDLLVACVIGDGEAETAPLEGSWKGIRFLDPAHDGAVLPILHLNEFKIAGPTVLGRAPEADVLDLLHGHGYAPRIVAGDDPRQVHRDFAAALDGAHAEIRAIQQRRPRRHRARRRDAALAGDRAAHAEGLDRAARGRRHARRGDVSLPSGPAGGRAREPRAPRAARGAGCAPTGPRRASTRAARSRRSSPRSRRAATGGWARCRTPTAAACSTALDLPDPAAYAQPVTRAGGDPRGVDARARRAAARRLRAHRAAARLPPLLPRRDELQPARLGVRGRGPDAARRAARPTSTSRRTAA